MSVIIDAHGERVMTDILVVGYVRENTVQFDVAVPEDVVAMIFMFWFIDVCDQWDQSLCHESVNIDGPRAEIKESGWRSVFGKQSVEQGTFEWRIKYNTIIHSIGIGLIRDDLKVLKKYRNTNLHASEHEGIVLGASDMLILDGLEHSCYGYCDMRTAKGTIITMTLNMDSNTIAFKINDKQYETKRIPLSINKYRLVITMDAEDAEIELL